MGKIVSVLVFASHAVTAKIGNADFFPFFYALAIKATHLHKLLCPRILPAMNKSRKKGNNQTALE